MDEKFITVERTTSPLDISILIHYYCSNRDVENLNARAVIESINFFLGLGLLEKSDEEGVNFKSNREALEVYIDALCDVKFPISKWIIED